MSLINDALRKARQEAAEREAEERGAAYRPPRAHLPAESKMGIGMIVGVALGFLIAFAAAALFFTRQGPPEGSATEPTTPQAASQPADPAPANPTQAEPAATQAAAPPPESVAPPQENVAMTPPPTSPSESAPRQEADSQAADGSPGAANPSEPVDGAGAAGQPTTGNPPAANLPRVGDLGPAPRPPEHLEEGYEPGKGSVSAPPEVSPNAGTEAPGPPQADEAGSPPSIQPPEKVGQVENTNVFVLEADLGDITLVLDFIAWVPDRPFAQINGQQVETGQILEGLLVEKIERDRVTLRGADGRLVLRVR